MILVPKGNIDTQWIGLLKVLWKVIGAIIDTRIKKAVTFHDVFNGFHVGRGMGTATMEIKFAQ